MNDTTMLKDRVRVSVEAQADGLLALSHRIHANPEVAWEEFQSSAWLVEYLTAQGFAVEYPVGGVATAFRAVYGTGKPTIAVIAEYDALPQIGHGCGHNIMASSAVGAGVAVKQVVDALGGRVVVIGAPAEEAGGGKVSLIRAGVFSDVDVALITHPGTRTSVLARSLAWAELRVEYFGRATHAAARPEDGINALDGLILAYNSIAALRQHIRSSARIHGIITDGGMAPNIVPLHAAGWFYVRAADDSYLDELCERVINCFRGAALATGTRFEHRWSENRYAAMRNNLTLAETHAANLESLGRQVIPPDPERGIGSTDMGNVSHAVPAIHPSIDIAPEGVLGHSREFAEASCSREGDRAALDAAKAMAMTAVDLLADPALMQRIRDEFASGR